MLRARAYIYPIFPTIYVISERDNTTGKRRVFNANMYISGREEELSSIWEGYT